MVPKQLDVPLRRQEQPDSCALACLRMVGAFYGDEWSEDLLRSRVTKGKFGVTAPNVAALARGLGYQSEVVSATVVELAVLVAARRPAIVYLRTGNLPGLPADRYHAVVVTHVTAQAVALNDPDSGSRQTLPLVEFLRAWTATECTAIVAFPRRS